MPQPNPQPSRVRTPERETFLADLFHNIFEDFGTNSWRRVTKYHWSDLPQSEYHGEILEIGDGDMNVRHRVDIEIIAKGVNRVLEPNFKIGSIHRANIRMAHEGNDAGEVDAYDSDIILQAALFGEIVYG